LHPDYVFVGELRSVCDVGLRDNEPCGCGKAFRECPFWQEVFQVAFGGFDTPQAGELTRLLARMNYEPYDLKRLWSVLMFRKGDGEMPSRLRPVAALYAAILKVSGARVVVDSSKSLRYAALLMATPGLEPRLTNLVRDPRGLIASRSKRARRRDGAERTGDTTTRRMRVLSTVAKWAIRNSLSARILRRDGGIRLRYEDFTEDQVWYLKSVLGEKAAAVVTQKLARGVESDFVQHQIGGNWVRGLRISPNERWRTELPAAPRLVAGFLSAPLRSVYGTRNYDRQTDRGSVPRDTTGRSQQLE
jgi:hypothetical protein